MRATELSRKAATSPSTVLTVSEPGVNGGMGGALGAGGGRGGKGGGGEGATWQMHCLVGSHSPFQVTIGTFKLSLYSDVQITSPITELQLELVRLRTQPGGETLFEHVPPVRTEQPALIKDTVVAVSPRAMAAPSHSVRVVMGEAQLPI